MVGSSIRTIIQNKHQNQHKNVSLSTKLIFYHGRPSPLTWTLQKMSEVNWREEAVNLKDLERFWMKEWSLISCQVFSNLIRHYRRKLGAVILGKWCCNNKEPWTLNLAIIGCQWLWPTWTRESIYFTMRPPHTHFQLFYFSDRLEFCEFFEWKIKRINNADLFSQPPLLIFTKGANISGGHCIYLFLFIYFH